MLEILEIPKTMQKQKIKIYLSSIKITRVFKDILCEFYKLRFLESAGDVIIEILEY